MGIQPGRTCSKSPQKNTKNNDNKKDKLYKAARQTITVQNGKNGTIPVLNTGYYG